MGGRRGGEREHILSPFWLELRRMSEVKESSKADRLKLSRRVQMPCQGICRNQKWYVVRKVTGALYSLDWRTLRPKTH